MAIWGALPHAVMRVGTGWPRCGSATVREPDPLSGGDARMKIREVPWSILGGGYSHEEIDAITKILRAQVDARAGFRRQPEERQFEQAFRAHEDAGYAVAINSCGTGLDMAMWMLGVGPGDEVITSPLTFVATAQSVIRTGAKLVFADVSPVTGNLDPVKAAERMTRRPKVILPVHMNGMPADLGGFADL